MYIVELVPLVLMFTSVRIPLFAAHSFSLTSTRSIMTTPKAGILVEVEADDLFDAPPEVKEFLFILSSRKQNSRKQVSMSADLDNPEPNSKIRQLQSLDTLKLSFVALAVQASDHKLLPLYSQLTTVINAIAKQINDDFRHTGCRSLTTRPKPRNHEPLDHLQETYTSVKFAHIPSQKIAQHTSSDAQLPDVDDNADQTTFSQSPSHEVTPSHTQNHQSPTDTIINNASLDISRNPAQILTKRIEWGLQNWQGQSLGVFRPGCKITGEILDKLLRINSPRHYIIRDPLTALKKLPQLPDGIIMPFWVSHDDQLSPQHQNHFAIAILDIKNRLFVSWGVDKLLVRKTKVFYENELDCKLSETTKQVTLPTLFV